VEDELLSLLVEPPPKSMEVDESEDDDDILIIHAPTEPMLIDEHFPQPTQVTNSPETNQLQKSPSPEQVIQPIVQPMLPSPPPSTFTTIKRIVEEPK